MTPSGTSKTSANPFAQTAVTEIDQDDLVDVPTLHVEARQLLQRALKQAGRGFGQLIALVGDPGAGKSHLLWWLRRQQRPESLTVAIPALPDLAQPFRFTLKQLVSGLCRVDKKGAKLERPIDRLLWDVIFSQTYDLLDAARVGMYQGPTAVLKQLGPLCLDGGKRRPLADFAEAAQKAWPEIEPGLRSYLLTLPTENSLDATARQVIVQFPYADRRALTTAWLAGEDLSQKDREKIGAKQTINQEATARYVLCSLIRLATIRRPASFTILFDQADQVLEQLGQPGLHALAEVMGSLHGLTAATLLLLSCRPDTFGQFSEKQARPGPSQIKQSMELISLARTAPPQLREVVTARLQAVAPGAATSLHPLQEADLSVLHEVDTPRAALLRLAALYSERLASGGAQIKPTAAAKTTPAPAAAGKPAAAKIDPSAAKTTDNTRPVVISKAAATAAKAAAEKPAKPSVAPVEKAAKASEPVPSATKPAESQATPSKAWMAMSGEGDALADAMAQAEKGEVSVDKVRSVTHVDKSGPAVPKEAKLAPTAKVVLKDTAPKQVQSAAPVSRADSGDTVRRVPDEALIAKTRDAAAKTTAKAAAPSVKTTAPSVAPSAKPAEPAKPAEAAKAVAPAKAAAKPTPAPAPATTAEKAKPAAAPAKPAAPARAPSSDTPSKAWLDMAGDNDPLADAIAAARAELAPSFAAEAAKPIKAKPVEPLPKTSKPLVPTDFEPTRQIVIPPGMTGFPDFAALSSEDKTEIGTAESAVSPSVSWLAMANDESVLPSDVGAGKADASKGGRAPRGTAAMGVVVPGVTAAPAKSAAPAPASAKAARSTQARIAPVAVHKGSSLSPLRVLAVLEGRSSMPEWQLAESLGVSTDSLTELLNVMATDRQVKLVPSEEGRMVVPL